MRSYLDFYRKYNVHLSDLYAYGILDEENLDQVESMALLYEDEIGFFDIIVEVTTISIYTVVYNFLFNAKIILS